MKLASVCDDNSFRQLLSRISDCSVLRTLLSALGDILQICSVQAVEHYFPMKLRHLITAEVHFDNAQILREDRGEHIADEVALET